MYSIEEHKQMFNAKVLEDQAKKGKNSRMLTKEHYTETVNRLKMLENISEQRGLSDYNLMRRFALFPCPCKSSCGHWQNRNFI